MHFVLTLGYLRNLMELDANIELLIHSELIWSVQSKMHDNWKFTYSFQFCWLIQYLNKLLSDCIIYLYVHWTCTGLRLYFSLWLWTGVFCLLSSLSACLLMLTIQLFSFIHLHAYIWVSTPARLHLESVNCIIQQSAAIFSLVLLKLYVHLAAGLFMGSYKGSWLFCTVKKVPIIQCKQPKNELRKPRFKPLIVGSVGLLSIKIALHRWHTAWSNN